MEMKKRSSFFIFTVTHNLKNKVPLLQYLIRRSSEDTRNQKQKIANSFVGETPKIPPKTDEAHIECKKLIATMFADCCWVGTEGGTTNSCPKNGGDGWANHWEMECEEAAVINDIIKIAYILKHSQT